MSFPLSNESIIPSHHLIMSTLKTLLQKTFQYYKVGGFVTLAIGTGGMAGSTMMGYSKIDPKTETLAFSTECMAKALQSSVLWPTVPYDIVTKKSNWFIIGDDCEITRDNGNLTVVSSRGDNWNCTWTYSKTVATSENGKGMDKVVSL